MYYIHIPYIYIYTYVYTHKWARVSRGMMHEDVQKCSNRWSLSWKLAISLRPLPICFIICSISLEPVRGISSWCHVQASAVRSRLPLITNPSHILCLCCEWNDFMLNHVESCWIQTAHCSLLFSALKIARLCRGRCATHKQQPATGKTPQGEQNLPAGINYTIQINIQRHPPVNASWSLVSEKVLDSQ